MPGKPRVQFPEALAEDHKNKREHPDMIPSASEWTKIMECDCGC